MRKGWGYALVVLVGGLALSVGLVARRWDFGSAADDLDHAARDYRAAGLPWTSADLAAPVPKVSNAAPLLRKAFDAIPPREGPSSGLVLSRYDAALKIAHEAVKRPASDFGVDWDRGLQVRFRFAESASASGLAQAFAARAVRRSTLGDDAGALADLEDARRLGALIVSEPSLMGSMTGNSCLYAALLGAQSCLASSIDRPDRISRYRAWIAAPLPQPDYGRAWRGEIYQAVATARNLSREQVAGFLLPGLGINPWRAEPAKPLRREGLPKEPFARAFMARCLRMNTELARATHGLNDPSGHVTEVAQAIQKRAARSDGFSHNLDVLMFPICRFDWMQSRVQATRAVALACANALLVHARTGRWPTSLTTPDPWGAGPLKVRADATGFRVWSVGPNGFDEGGFTWTETRQEGRHSDDVVVLYPSRAKERHPSSSPRSPAGNRAPGRS